MNCVPKKLIFVLNLVFLQCVIVILDGHVYLGGLSFSSRTMTEMGMMTTMCDNECIEYLGGLSFSSRTMTEMGMMTTLYDIGRIEYLGGLSFSSRTMTEIGMMTTM